MPTYEVTFTATITLEAPNAAAAKAALMDDGGRLGVGRFRLTSASARSLRSPSGALKRDNDWWVTSKVGAGRFSNMRRVAPQEMMSRILEDNVIEREALTALLDQIDSADPHQKDPSLQAQRALIIMKLTNVTELNTTKLPPSPPRSLTDN